MQLLNSAPWRHFSQIVNAAFCNLYLGCFYFSCLKEAFNCGIVASPIAISICGSTVH